MSNDSLSKREQQVRYFNANMYNIRGAVFTIANQHSGIDLHDLLAKLKAVQDTISPFLPPRE